MSGWGALPSPPLTPTPATRVPQQARTSQYRPASTPISQQHPYLPPPVRAPSAAILGSEGRSWIGYHQQQHQHQCAYPLSSWDDASAHHLTYRRQFAKVLHESRAHPHLARGRSHSRLARVCLSQRTAGQSWDTTTSMGVRIRL